MLAGFSPSKKSAAIPQPSVEVSPEQFVAAAVANNTARPFPMDGYPDAVAIGGGVYSADGVPLAHIGPVGPPGHTGPTGLNAVIGTDFAAPGTRDQTVVAVVLMAAAEAATADSSQNFSDNPGDAQ